MVVEGGWTLPEALMEVAGMCMVKFSFECLRVACQGLKPISSLECQPPACGPDQPSCQTSEDSTTGIPNKPVPAAPGIELVEILKAKNAAQEQVLNASGAKK
ncbi:hypothetical protein MDA_GLEAN10008534 [Myotis davidii]|uniref:Uncharacterized protein n=1 Tax=Myotis davidii TaxID=225400 RepID=L5M6Q2_MYODS|nr:hypothetical protein MDA_GLEAN10008534 [Myotis davidii]